LALAQVSGQPGLAEHLPFNPSGAVADCERCHVRIGGRIRVSAFRNGKSAGP